MDPWLAIALITACLGAKAFVSGAEIALFSANKSKIRQNAEQGSRLARLILRTIENPEPLLGSTLIAHKLVLISGTSVATALIIHGLGHGGQWVAFWLMAILFLTAGGIIPKAIFQHFANQLVGIAIYPLRVVLHMCYPIVRVMVWPIGQGLRLLGLPSDERQIFTAREEIGLLVRFGEQPSLLGVDEQRMIRRIFGFSDTRVHEAMIPLVQVIALEDTACVDEILQAIRQHGFSRIPIFQDNIHNIVGWVNAFDVLSLPHDARSFRQLIRPAYYVPEKRRVGDLLRDVQQKGVPLAVVVDEYGGSVGIVTIEDMVEEIVGDIEDEYDARQHLYEVLPDGSFRIDARMEIDAINEVLSLPLPTGDYTTLAGFILDRLERIPLRGELLMHEGLMLEIEEATNRAVERVRIFPQAAPPEGQDKNGA